LRGWTYFDIAVQALSLLNMVIIVLELGGNYSLFGSLGSFFVA